MGATAPEAPTTALTATSATAQHGDGFIPWSVTVAPSGDGTLDILAGEATYLPDHTECSADSGQGGLVVLGLI